MRLAYDSGHANAIVKSQWLDGTIWSRVDVGVPGVLLASAVAAMGISAAVALLALRPRLDQVG